MASFQRADATPQSQHYQQFSHLHGVNTIELPLPPSNFPLLNPPASTPSVRNSQTFNTSTMSPPTFCHPPPTPPPFNPPTMNPPPLTHPVLHQPALNPPPGLIEELMNRPTSRQPMQPQHMNLPNLNHPPVVEFTFVMEYMGERIAIHTDQPTRFQILFLCNVASSALHNEYSPRNHIFRPMVAPRWMGRFVMVHSDALLRVVVHQCISRGEYRLYIWVYFIADVGLQQPPGRVVNAGSSDALMSPHLVAVAHPHQPQSMPHSVLSNQVDTPQAQSLPLPVRTPGHPHQARPVRPFVSNPVAASAGQSALAAISEAVGIPITTPTAALPVASQTIGTAAEVSTVVTPSVEVVIPAGGNDQSNARRKYKCQNCGRVGHSKRSCKLVNPVLTKVTVSGLGKQPTAQCRAGPSADAEVPTVVVQSDKSD